MTVSLDRQFFFRSVSRSLFKGSLDPARIEGMNAILDYWDANLATADRRWLAYILATAFHETAYTMQPVRETLAESDSRAVEILEAAFAAGRLSWVKSPYWRADEEGKSWLGRGLVQLTHKRNYEAMSEVTGCEGRAVTSVGRLSRWAHATAAFVAGPPAAVKKSRAATFSSGEGRRFTRCTTSHVHSPANTTWAGPDMTSAYDCQPRRVANETLEP